MRDTFPIPSIQSLHSTVYVLGTLWVCISSLGAGTSATSSGSFTDWNIITCPKTKAYNSKQACNDILPDIERPPHTHAVLFTSLTTTRHKVIESPRHALLPSPHQEFVPMALPLAAGRQAGS